MAGWSSSLLVWTGVAESKTWQKHGCVAVLKAEEERKRLEEEALVVVERRQQEEPEREESWQMAEVNEGREKAEGGDLWGKGGGEEGQEWWRRLR